MSTKNSPHSKIHAEAVAAAEHLHKTWRTGPRKDLDHCKIALAMDDGFRFIHIPWVDLETADVDALTIAICGIMRKDAGTYEVSIKPPTTH